MSEKLTEPAIRLSGVRKIYRLYHSPVTRVLDLLGLLPEGPEYYGEHLVLDGIDLEIPRGQKVAVVGRNGTGKSTLLKIISGLIQTTSGTVEVQGKLSALLQIGAGFDPTLTGRQNTHASLAYQGITGREAEAKTAEIVDFAELEEYIDQPMHTYSTGMSMRLMFSASVFIDPDIFVVDEVLGVGDAYFTHKSFERLSSLCERHGTTLLLVTHDIYSAMHLCERYVWLDGGVIRLDADPETVTAAYEHSVRQQEEEHHRKRLLAALPKGPEKACTAVLRIASRTGFALPAPLALARTEIELSDGRALTQSVATGARDWELLPQSNLGPKETVDGRECRRLLPHGSVFHKVEWAVRAPGDAELQNLRLDYNYEGEEPAEVSLEARGRGVLLRASLPKTDGWQEVEFRVSGAAVAEPLSALKGQYGNGLIRIERVEFLDREGLPATYVPHGGRLVIRVHFRIAGPLPTKYTTFVLTFNKPGTAHTGCVFADRLPLPDGREFVLEIEIEALLLGSGPWLVNIGFGEENLYWKDTVKVYFPVNDKWYHLCVRAFELHVGHTASVDSYVFYVQPAQMTLKHVGPAVAASNSGHPGSFRRVAEEAPKRLACLDK